jgi:uncharacterized protein YecT (DUF1311 family)
LALLTTGAQAKAPDTSTREGGAVEYENCSARDSHAAAIDCSRREYDRLKKLLDAAYNQLVSISDPNLRPFLAAAQRQWSAYRKAETSYVEEEDGGQIGEEVANDLDLKMMADRIQELNRDIIFKKRQTLPLKKAQPAAK